MKHFDEKQFGVEISQGLSMSQIEEIHHLLDENFGITLEDKIEGGETTFYLIGLNVTQQESAWKQVSDFLGELYAVQLVQRKIEGEAHPALVITKREN